MHFERSRYKFVKPLTIEEESSSKEAFEDKSKCKSRYLFLFF